MMGRLAGLIPMFLAAGLMVLVGFSTLPRRNHPGFLMFMVGIVLFWIVVTLTWEMGKEVDRLAPARSLYQATDTRRIWREHKQLFPNSRLRANMQLLIVLAVGCFLGGFVLIW